MWYHRLSDLDGLEAVFRHIQAKHISPSVTTYNILINAYIDSNLHTEVSFTATHLLPVIPVVSAQKHQVEVLPLIISSLSELSQ